MLKPCNLPNYSQEEVNRQNSTSSTLSFLRWGGDESLRDDRKKPLNVSHHNSSLSVSLSLIPALNISFIPAQRPLITENGTGQANAEMHVTHTIWACSFLRTSVPSQKMQSYCVNDRCQAIAEAEHPHSCVSVHFVRNKTQTRSEQSKWDQDQNCVCKTGTEMSVTCGKAAYANDV